MIENKPTSDIVKLLGYSMDGGGRSLDNIIIERLWHNVKHEDIYFKGYTTPKELQHELMKYFLFYSVTISQLQHNRKGLQYSR